MTEKRYASHRLRDGRWSSSGQIYLVTTVTNGRLPVFADFSAARTLIQVIRQDELLGCMRLGIPSCATKPVATYAAAAP